MVGGVVRGPAGVAALPDIAANVLVTALVLNVLLPLVLGAALALEIASFGGSVLTC